MNRDNDIVVGCLLFVLRFPAGLALLACGGFLLDLFSVSSFPAGKLTRRFLWGCTGRKPFAYWNAPSPPGVDVKYCLLKVQKEFADSKTYGGVTEFTSRKSGKTVGGRLSISICHWVKAYSGKFRVDGEVSQCRTVSNVHLSVARRKSLAASMNTSERCFGLSIVLRFCFTSV